jgi:hypothetical protein
MFQIANYNKFPEGIGFSSNMVLLGVTFTNGWLKIRIKRSGLYNEDLIDLCKMGIEMENGN